MKRGSMAQPPDRVSLRHYLLTFQSFLHQEDAWALCYQSIRHVINSSRKLRPIRDFDDVYIHSDGSVELSTHSKDNFISESKFLFDLGAVLFKALYYGLGESEVRSLQPSLEELLDRLTFEADVTDSSGEICDDQVTPHQVQSSVNCNQQSNTRQSEPVTLETIQNLCINHLPDPREADRYYRDLCSALYAEANLDLKLLLKVASSGQCIRDEMDAYNESSSEAIRDDVKFQEWACLWIQVVRDLKDGVKLRKVNVNHNKNGDEFDLTPYEMLLRDIRDRNYNLRHIDSESIANMKKDTHALILELIRTRPKLVPASQRILRPEPVKISTIHEKLMQEVRSCPKLRHIAHPCALTSTCSTTTTPLANTSTTTMYNVQQRLLNLRESASPSPKRRLIKADIDLTLSCSIDPQQLNHKNIDDDNLLNNVNDKNRFISTLHNGSQRVINNNVNMNNNNNHTNNQRSHDRKHTSLLYKAFARILNLDLRY